MAVVHPQNLTDGSDHSYDSCGIDIAEFKGNKKENDREEVE
jgi:hypothetical protein